MADQKMVDGLTFQQWLKAVDRVLMARVGVGHRDLADWMWWDAWESGMSARDAALEAFEEDFSDYGW